MRRENSEARQEAYSIDGFCRAYGYGRSTTYRAIAEGRLRGVKASGRTLILRADAEAWANSLPAIEPKLAV
jgi:hypothetical protein